MKFAFISHADRLVTLNPKWTSKAHCIESWALCLDADHFSGCSGNEQTWKSLNNYDVILINQNTTMHKLTCEIKKNCPHPFLIAVAEGSVSDISAFSSKTLFTMIQAARSCDLYGILLDWTVPCYAQLTNKPVRWIGLPFYQEFFSSRRLPLEQKNPKAPIIALQHSPGSGRSGFSSFLIASKIPGAKLLSPGLQSGSQEFIDFLGVKNVDHFPYLEWPEYISKYSHSYFAIHLDTLYTYGRFPLDMAALGIPTVGSNRNQTNKILWPELTVDPIKEIPRAQELALQLINDPDFYRGQVAAGLFALAQFNPDDAKSRLLDIINNLSKPI